MSEQSEISVKVDLQLPQGDDDRLDQLTRQLRQELLDIGVESAEYIHQGKVPQGAKVVDPIILGTLLVAVGPIVLTKFLEFLQAWVMRSEGRTVKLSLQAADGASVQVEVPETMSPVEVKRWLDTVNKTLAGSQELQRKNINPKSS